MPSIEHNKLIERVSELDIWPQENAKFVNWLTAEEHLTLLRNNAEEEELIVYACGPNTFIHAVAVDKDILPLLEHSELLSWNGSPFTSCASYAWNGGGSEVWVEQNEGPWFPRIFKGARLLVFGREFEGLEGKERFSYEILQEYSHLARIIWREEHNAYCRFDEHGDLENVVSVTFSKNSSDITLISFQRKPLEQYLAASNSVLIRIFDFTLLRRGKEYDFEGWSDGPETLCAESKELLYRQKVDVGKASYTTGIQVLRSKQPKREIFSQIIDPRNEASEQIDFITLDWHTECSTRETAFPSDAGKFFVASGNFPPRDLSPAFFRPEVLSKYKADREKFTIDERYRSISCRGIWMLRSFDRNEAGQIYAYVCDLWKLPIKEQEYWKSFNEKPKAGISKRSFLNDFKGEPVDYHEPLVEILTFAEKWNKTNIAWWVLGDMSLLKGVNTPLTESRDEWGNAFLGLSNLIVESFRIQELRKKLTELNLEFEANEKSLKLLERIVIGLKIVDQGARLNGLRTVHNIRSKLVAHSSSTEATKLFRDAIKKHGSLHAHFEYVCRQIIVELEEIETAFSKRQQ